MLHINDRVKVVKAAGNCLPGSKGKVQDISPDGLLNVTIYEDAYGNEIKHQLVGCKEDRFVKDEVTLHSRIRRAPNEPG